MIQSNKIIKHNYILLDAVYVNNSGGLVLLKYLVGELQKSKADVFFLLDERIKHLSLVEGDNVEYVVGAEKSRRLLYNTHGDEFDVVLCFGNIPPTKRLRAKVYTYFQNVTLFDISKQIPLKLWPKWLLKRLYIKSLKRNTDKWIIQTTNTQQLVMRTLGLPERDVLLYPYYDESVFPSISEKSADAKDYAYIAKYIPEKNHGMLISAWLDLAKKGITPTLHLTADGLPGDIQQMIDETNAIGGNIINHGFCSLEQVKAIYEQSKAVVYTSMNESFGLGMIEAMNLGCDVIGPKLPYVTSICDPSESFDYNLQSLIEAIARYEQGQSPKTKCLVRNKINELIELLTNNK